MAPDYCELCFADADTWAMANRRGPFGVEMVGKEYLCPDCAQWQLDWNSWSPEERRRYLEACHVHVVEQEARRRAGEIGG